MFLPSADGSSGDGIRASETGIANGREPSVDAGDQTQVFWKKTSTLNIELYIHSSLNFLKLQ